MKDDAKLVYSAPNFRNPTGITCSQNKPQAEAEKLSDNRMIFVENNPYGELRFMGEDRPYTKNYLCQRIIY